MGFSLAKGSGIHTNCSFNAAEHLSMGINSVFNARCRIDTRGTVTIGNNVAISSDVIIITADHNIHAANFASRARPVIIEDHVWVGTRAMILPGVKLGYGCVVAAGSLVSKNIAPFEVVAGVPAKKIGERGCKSGYTYNTSYNRLFH